MGTKDPILYAADKSDPYIPPSSSAPLSCKQEEFLTEEEVINFTPETSFNPSLYVRATPALRASLPIFKDSFWQPSNAAGLPPPVKIESTVAPRILHRHILSLEKVSRYRYFFQEGVLYISHSFYQENSSIPLPPMAAPFFKEEKEENNFSRLKLPYWPLTPASSSPSKK